MPHDKGVRYNQRTGDQAGFYHPFILYRVPVWADEKYRDDKMPEGEPVIAVCQKRISRVQFSESFTDPGKPRSEGGPKFSDGG